MLPHLMPGWPETLSVAFDLAIWTLLVAAGVWWLASWLRRRGKRD